MIDSATTNVNPQRDRASRPPIVKSVTEAAPTGARSKSKSASKSPSANAKASAESASGSIGRAAPEPPKPVKAATRAASRPAADGPKPVESDVSAWEEALSPTIETAPAKTASRPRRAVGSASSKRARAKPASEAGPVAGATEVTPEANRSTSKSASEPESSDVRIETATEPVRTASGNRLKSFKVKAGFEAATPQLEVARHGRYWNFCCFRSPGR